MARNEMSRFHKYYQHNKVKISNARKCTVACDSCNAHISKANISRHKSHCKHAPFDNTADEFKSNVDVDFGLMDFKVESLTLFARPNQINFISPFTCKIVAPRGGGKTTFVVNYILKNAQYQFSKVYFITSTPEQPLITMLDSIPNVIVGSTDLLTEDAIARSKVLIVLDDLMHDLRHNGHVQDLYCNGRHKAISIISLEQDLFYSNIVERRNVDYMVLFKIRDIEAMNRYYRNFCTDIPQWRFIDMYNFCVQNNGFLIIDWISKYRYRLNSFNIYLNTETFDVAAIVTDDETFAEVRNAYTTFQRKSAYKYEQKPRITNKRDSKLNNKNKTSENENEDCDSDY